MDANSTPSWTQAAPLVILPGLICDARMFAGQVEAFGATVVDGFYGAADRIGAMADYALARMPDRCTLLGHSMGARVALEIWARAPARVDRLIFADTGAHPVSDKERAGRVALRDLGRSEGSAALVDRWLPPMVGPHRRDDGVFMRTMRTMAIDGGCAAYERQIEALLHRPDAAAVLPTITCPTLFLVGADDAWSPPAQHAAMARDVPGAQLRIIADAGHMAPAEAPEQFNRCISEWLDNT
ncbi:alpha/beta fold hydrolase [Novosphingobium sp.]|uniref:alpha/beta fold hydrolase n=1 Tax=Novosphingobium sp. TaxID=1874826 RepID=UPI003D0DBDB2